MAWCNLQSALLCIQNELHMGLPILAVNTCLELFLRLLKSTTVY